MSHAANIKSRHRPATDAHSPSKRRRTDDAHAINGLGSLTNGTIPKDAFVALPSKTVKIPSTAQPLDSSAKVRPADEYNSASEESADDSSAAEGAEESEDDADEDADVEPASTDIRGDAPGIDEEPSFGDLLQRAGQVVDVEAALVKTHDPTVVEQPRALSVPNATSLGTVLTQALRTNDVNLLESCLQVNNLDSIRATIERLQSPHASKLLQKLAERLHKRPGRAGSLMVWVQWTIVAHGGYLATQPGAMRELHTLYQVVRQRATSLQPLLQLKGKLDMLEAQLQLRRNMQEQSARAVPSVVTYVEGEDSSDDSDAESDADDAARIKRRIDYSAARLARAHEAPAANGHLSDDDDDMPTTLPNGLKINGYASDQDADGAESDSDDEDIEDLIDDEAEESETDDSEAGLSDEVDFDDDEVEDGDSADAADALESGSSDSEPEPAAARPVKRSRH